MSTIHIGAFVRSMDASRLDALGGAVESEGDSFLDWGAAPRDGDPVHLRVDVAAVGNVSPSAIRDGYARLDAVLQDGERLADYAVVTDDAGTVTQMLTLLTGGVHEVTPVRVRPPRTAEARTARRRWSPFR